MRHPIRDLQHPFRRPGPERRFRRRRPTVEALEERSLLSAAPHLDVHGLEDAHRHARRAVSGYLQTNLVSDGAVGAQVVDSNLKNPWGMAFSPTTSTSTGGPFWIADAGSGVATIYAVSPATDTATKLSLVVTIPGGGPTGQVFNSTSDFLLPGPSGSVPAVFLFDTLSGTIAGWAPASSGGPSAAVTVVNNGSSGASYTGLALGSSSGQNYLYAANGGASPGIEVYNSSFTRVTLAGDFIDPKLRKGFAKKLVPYNIQNIGGELFVTYRGRTSFYAKGGAVAEFNTDGTFVRQIAFNKPRGHLQAPWGVALAPADFGKFSNALLVGNFANGRINAYDFATGKFLGVLEDTHRKPIVNVGLWALGFGNDGRAGSSSTLFFTAGINGQADGLFGSLVPVTA